MWFILVFVFHVYTSHCPICAFEKTLKLLKRYIFYLGNKRGKCGTTKFFLLFCLFFYFLYGTFKGGNTSLQNHQKCPFWVPTAVIEFWSSCWLWHAFLYRTLGICLNVVLIVFGTEQSEIFVVMTQPLLEKVQVAPWIKAKYLVCVPFHVFHVVLQSVNWMLQDSLGR